jgi:predicted acetyltransferase
MQITLLPAAASEQPALANLLQLYYYDLSEVTGADVDESGRFGSVQLDMYWTEAGYHAFLFRVERQLAGFALVNGQSRLHTSFQGRSIAHLFVLRRYRRQGVGRTIAMQLFDRFPGAWEVSSSADNVPGHVFWRSVVDHYTDGHYAEAWLQTPLWRGPVESFVAPPSHT